MKRCLSAILAAILLLVCIPFTASAAGRPTLSVDGATVQVGDTFTVAVRATNATGLSKLRMWVSYDSAALELIAQEKGPSGTVQFGQSSNPFEITQNGGAGSDVVLAYLTFRVKATEARITTLRVDYNSKYTSKTCDTQNNLVCIGLPRPGDADSDSATTMKDVGVLQQSLAHWDVTVDRAAADVYADGKVNNKDLALLQRYMAGWDVTLAPAVDHLPADRVVTLPAIGTDIDVTKKKNRILVQDTFILGDTLFMKVYNKTSNWITEETNYIRYTCYDANGTAIGTEPTTLYIGVIDTKSNSQKIFALSAPAGTAEIKITESKIVYWTEWS